MRRPAEPSKHSRYRARLRAEAIAALGGKCRACGYDRAAALNVCRTIKPRRGAMAPKPKYHGMGAMMHRRIVAGDHKGLELLCSNCTAIRTRSAGRIHRNVTKPARPRATPAAGATARDRR